ncbi:hypothetical protein [Smaragdicoccus niigatensis]|uniref:hypothetical protein n=1 Tax=Smaragdicoccus niigatensis TaxID=359359 RepID=UPI0003754FE2|nr:hypothetical protein [Smaragdicoccus niigatensis]
MSDHRDALAAELGGSLPDGFAELPVARLGWLVDKVRSVKAETAKSLEKSTTDSVNNLPVLLRGPARAILGAGK